MISRFHTHPLSRKENEKLDIKLFFLSYLILIHKCSNTFPWKLVNFPYSTNLTLKYKICASPILHLSIYTWKKDDFTVYLRCWSKLISSSTNGSKSSLCSTMYWTTFSLEENWFFFKKKIQVELNVMYCTELKWNCDVMQCL